MLAVKYPELEKPIFCVRRMSLLEKWREVQFHKNLWKTDERMRELHIRTEGREEGRAEGRSDEKFEIARRLKTKGFSLTEIIDITGLSTEVIETM